MRSGEAGDGDATGAAPEVGATAEDEVEPGPLVPGEQESRTAEYASIELEVAGTRNPDASTHWDGTLGMCMYAVIGADYSTIRPASTSSQPRKEGVRGVRGLSCLAEIRSGSA